jgi:hypothetical protein
MGRVEISSLQRLLLVLCMQQEECSNSYGLLMSFTNEEELNECKNNDRQH